MDRRLLGRHRLPSFVPFASAFPSIRVLPSAIQRPKNHRGVRPWAASALAFGLSLACIGWLVRGVAPQDDRPEQDQHKDRRELRAVVPRTVIAPSFRMDERGTAVHWRNASVDVVLDASLNDISPAAADAFSRALNAWRASGAELPSVSTVAGRERSVGYNASGPNENVVLFAKYGWPEAKGALAVTVLTYDALSGAILDADIVINGGGRYFADLSADEQLGTGDAVRLDPPQDGAAAAQEGAGGEQGTGASALSTGTSSNDSAAATTPSGSTNATNTTSLKGGRFDLQNILTHELGHFFGLGEDLDNSGSTMYVTTRPGETTKRSLDVADGRTLVGIYEGGLDTTAGAGVASGCGRSQISAGDPARVGGGRLAVVGAAIVAALKYRRRRSSGAKGPKK